MVWSHFGLVTSGEMAPLLGLGYIITWSNCLGNVDYS